MPRIGRYKLNTNYFHIIVQGINKEYIFDNELYMKKYQYLISLNLKKFDVQLVAYCIMNNHTHMLIYAEDINQLSKFMQCVNTSFSKYYNEQKNRVGVVFKSRYKSQPIYDYKYICNCIVYIHNNPVKAKITKTPGEYKYSSYNDYINRKINERSMEIICNNRSDFLDTFIKLHNDDYCQEFVDYTENIDYDKQIKELLAKNIGEIILDDKLLETTIKNLIINHKIPIKKVCEIFRLTRYKISILLKK